MADPLTEAALAAHVLRVKTLGMEGALRTLLLGDAIPATLASPQGLMVLRATLLLLPLLSEASGQGLLAAQAGGPGLGPLPTPVGDPETYAELRARVAPDMASTGFKGILAHQLEDLAGRLDLGPALLPLLQSTCASLPVDTYWHQRALKRLDGPILTLASDEPVRVLCEGGLAEVLAQGAALLQQGRPLLGILAEGASRKLLEAGRGLQGRCSWLFVHLASLEGSGPAPWLQAAALINLFPSEEWPSLEVCEGGGSPEALLEAILDGDTRQARSLALQCLHLGEPMALLRLLAEAAASSDPLNDGGHRLLATAAVAELLPRLDPGPQRWVLFALACNLAATQSSGDRVALGRRAWLAQG